MEREPCINPHAVPACLRVDNISIAYKDTSESFVGHPHAKKYARKADAAL